ncbi:MAG: transposase DNA-binding-containing protein, partial [Thiohalocapsa sp.]
MNTQNQIKRTLEQAAAIETIRATLAGGDVENRSRLADALCEQFGFHDPRGHLQRAGCLRALRELEQAGHFQLPASRLRAVFKAREPRRLCEAVAAPTGVPAHDYEAKYALHPWLLESFIDTETHRGSCYGAANWSCIGQTAGRGRQDRHTRKQETLKAVYVYPLETDFRALMEISEPAGSPPLEPGAGMDGPQWAQQGFGEACLGDTRLSRRLVDSARRQAHKPGDAFSAAAEGERATVKGYYRMIDQPDPSPITMDAML